MTRPYFKKTLTHPENSENGGTGGGKRLGVGETVGGGGGGGGFASVCMWVWECVCRCREEEGQSEICNALLKKLSKDSGH